jgi:hypothetical protein
VTNDKNPVGRSLVIALVVWITILAVSAVGILVWVWNENMRIEAGKAALQILVTAIAGTVLGIIVFLFQENHKRNLDAVQLRSDERREDIQRESDARREIWMRTVEDIKDERRREDELLHRTLDESIAAYNQVKSIRRMLKAETLVVQQRRITSVTYARYMERLNELQLEFERLKTGAPLVKNVFDTRAKNSAKQHEPPKNVSENLDPGITFREIESYLNRVIGEYEKNRSEVEDFEREREDAGDSEAPGMPLEDRLPKLLDFIGSGFYFNVSLKIDKLSNSLREALLVPLILPLIDDGAKRQSPER